MLNVSYILDNLQRAPENVVYMYSGTFPGALRFFKVI